MLIDGQAVPQSIPLFDNGPNSSGVEVTLIAPSAPRSDTFQATYSGDEDTNPSTSPPLVQTVAAPATIGPSGGSTSPEVTPATRSNPAVAATTGAALSSMTAPLIRTLRRSGLAAVAGARQTLRAAGPETLTQRIYTPHGATRHARRCRQAAKLCSRPAATVSPAPAAAR